MARMVKRVIICVDGTWFGSDGRLERETGNCSNVYRIWTAIKQGIVTDHHGRQIKQICRYFGGLRPGEASDDSKKATENRIREILKFCYDHTQNLMDELWLFGFSGGALIARVVAESLDRLRKESDIPPANHGGPESNTQKIRAMINLSKRRNIKEMFPDPFASKREPPAIRFLGLFDAVNDTKFEELDELLSSTSAEHVRHAVAINEDQKHLAPILFGGRRAPQNFSEESLIEAWFIGTHIDVGGGAKDDGLSLYPLQWMLIESKNHGLCLNESSGLASPGIDEDIFDLVFPSETQLSPSVSRQETGSPRADSSRWKFSYSNGLVVEMQDIRISHAHGNLQKPASSKLSKIRRPNSTPATSRRPWLPSRQRSTQHDHEGDNHKLESSVEASPLKPKIRRQHIVKLNKTDLLVRPGRLAFSSSQPREIFRADQIGELLGYCEQVPWGSIIHPSVFFLKDTYPVFLRDVFYSSQNNTKNLQAFRRSKLLQRDLDPWVSEYSMDHAKTSCRILVCGATGVGKSTLLNSVFGIPIAPTSDTLQGVHDVNEAFESDRHPGIIIHDSRGFQTGSTGELALLRSFLKERATSDDHAEALDAIWLCIDTMSPRKFQKAEEDLFRELKDCSSKTPVLVVCTKKDVLARLHESTTREVLRNANGGKPLDEDHVAHEVEAQINAALLINEIVAKKELCLIKMKLELEDLDSYRKKNEAQSEIEKVENELIHLRKELEAAMVPNPSAASSQLKEQLEFCEEGVPFVYTSRVDARSIRELVHNTLIQVQLFRPRATLALTAAQIADAKQKTWQAISQSVHLLRQNTWSWQNMIRHIPLADSVVTSVLSRILCDNIVRCFGFPNVKSEEVSKIVSNVIVLNLGKFMAQSLGQDFVNFGGMVVSPFLLGYSPPFLKLWPAARMVVKCASDLIIVLDGAFTLGGPAATAKHVKLALIKYSSTKDAEGMRTTSSRAKVHNEIGEKFPMKKRFYEHLEPRRAEKLMARIIFNNRLRAEERDSLVDLDKYKDVIADESLLNEEETALSQMRLDATTTTSHSSDDGTDSEASFRFSNGPARGSATASRTSTDEYKGQKYPDEGRDSGSDTDYSFD